VPDDRLAVPSETDPDGTAGRAEAAQRVRQWLADQGVPEAEIERAEGSGSLTLLVVDQLVMPGQPRYTADDVSRLSGVERPRAERLWRAMGFPDVRDDDVTFYDADLEAIQEFTGRLRSLWTPSYQDVYATRVVSSAMSRIAEVSTDELVATVDALRSEGVSDPEIACTCLDMLDVDAIERALGYVYRRQLRAALWRRLSDTRSPGSETVLTVGFVDLVRFTALTEQVAEDQLQRLVDRFEELAHEAVTQHNGRVVKMIGDAVMFVADSPVAALEVATELVDVYASDELLPPARAGLAYGPVLARGGDYFGPVINLASRIVDVARPKSVVVSDEMRAAVGDDERFSWRRLPAMRLKGIGSPPLWVLRRRRDHDDV
jgi:adenylate cyclase